MVAEAHKLKSASRSIGAMNLGDVCEQIEVAGRNDDALRCSTLATGLPNIFSQVESRIQDHLARSGN
jgi:HPt (histidine-containing phosphotransfer) domain-containing protein